MSTIKERIYEYAKHKSITIRTFEERCKMSNGYVSSMRKGLGVEKLENVLSAFPTINKQWLLTGEGEMERTPSYVADDVRPATPEERAAIAEHVKRGDAVWVPLIHIDSVGGIHSPNDILSPEYVESYIPMPGARPGDVAIYQSGNSMSPAIPAGSLLLIRPIDDWRNYIGYGDVFVLLLTDNRRITKEIRRYDPDPANYYWCVSYNPDVADEELPKRLVRRVWKVIKVLIDRGW